MRNLIIGIIIGALVFCGISYAKKIESPIKFTDLTVSNELVNLNTYLELVRDILNGDFTLKILTSNPDGSLKGTAGDIRLFNNSGTFYLEINTTGSTIWRGVVLTDTPWEEYEKTIYLINPFIITKYLLRGGTNKKP